MSMVLVHVWYVGLMEHSGEIADKIHARLFSPARVFHV